MDKLRVGVVGTGYLGKFHAEKYAGMEGAELAGIADIDISRAEKIADRLNTTAYQDYRSLYGKVDAVSIAVPTYSHFDIGRDFLENDIDILVEKPMTASLEEADELIRISESRGLIIQVGHLERFNPAVLALKEIIGKPRFIESHRLSIFNERGTDVSVVLDLMIHDIDIILNFADSEIRTTHATGISVVSKHVDIANARLEFQNGCVANITASRISAKNQRKLRLFQNDAYISVDFANHDITLVRKENGKENSLIPGMKIEKHDFPKSDALENELTAFVKSVKSREAPEVTGRVGRDALKIAMSIMDQINDTASRLRIKKKMTPVINPKCVMIIAGEASGDIHGAKLVMAMRKKNEDLFFCGIGGRELSNAGVKIITDASELAVVGITEAIHKLPVLLKSLANAKRLLKSLDPDLLILIDFPDFNLKLAAVAKSLNIPVLYYISPQIWAWRHGRVKKIKKLVDHIAVILPFEEEFYRNYQIPATYVGHPLLDNSPPALKHPLHKSNAPPVIGLVPGSRDKEIARHLPAMLGAARIMEKNLAKVQFLISLAPSVDGPAMENIINSMPKIPGIEIVRHKIEEVFERSDLVIATSGTVTLEAAISGVPMIIVYKVSPISYWIGKKLIKVHNIGLANLILGKEVVPELLQKDASPSTIAERAIEMIKAPRALDTMRDELLRVRSRLGKGGASKQVAGIAINMLNNSTKSNS